MESIKVKMCEIEDGQCQLVSMYRYNTPINSKILFVNISCQSCLTAWSKDFYDQGLISVTGYHF